MYYFCQNKIQKAMISILPLGEKMLVNRITERNTSTIIIPGSAKQNKGNCLKGVIMLKGQGSPLNSLNDVHISDVILYPSNSAVTVPDELKEELGLSGTIDIVEYKEIFATL